jgi:hypothetical protein
MWLNIVFPWRRSGRLEWGSERFTAGENIVGMLFFKMAVSIVLAVKLSATQRISAFKKLSCAMNSVTVSAKILFVGETLIIAGWKIALERPLVRPDVLAKLRINIALGLI